MSQDLPVARLSSATQGQSNLPPHHVGNSGPIGPLFRNPWDTYEQRSLTHVFKWHRERRKEGLPGAGEGHLIGIPQPTAEDYRRVFPLNPVDWGALANPPADAVQAVWVGHATVLVQMGGLTFITDPVFSDRCAPVQFVGPKRVVPPALTGTEPEMPPLDFVLISHNHYDHLDTGSVRTLYRRYGKALTWYVPLGLRSWFRCEGVPADSVVELDWWGSATHTSPTTGKSVTVTMVPAQHWSARGILDRFRTLWGGYVVTAPPPPATATVAAAAPATTNGTASTTTTTVTAFSSTSASAPAAADGTPAQESTPAAAAATAAASTTSGATGGGLRFYFVGDTGYCPVFREIGERLGPIDLAAIPIGAYEPRWFMRPQHTNAEEGLAIAQDVRAQVSIGIHAATWSLTDEPLDEPPTRLQAAVRDQGLPPSSFVTLQHGERAVVRGGRLVNEPRTLPVNVAAAAPKP